MQDILEINNVRFDYHNTQVLSDITFNVKKGDFIGLIGSNGSGKTTLLKLILGLLKIKEGNIKIDGVDIKEFKEWSKIGYVSQKATNIENNFPATVQEIVSMGLLSIKNFPKILSKDDEVKVHNSLKQVGMQHYFSRRIGELSGGQQQRVLIAKAMISKPKLLILDEPTTGIDQDSQIKFYKILGKLNNQGTTIILVSHDISSITHYVTKIASLNQSLEFYGSHEDFCAFDKKHKHETHNHKLCLDRG